MKSNFPKDMTVPDGDELEFGYIEPGHGSKGKKDWISSDNDVFDMVEQCKARKEIMLCYSKSEGTGASKSH